MAKKGLYPELFHEALRRHYSLSMRSENHDSYLDLFSDNGQLDLLKNPDWQVIFGRRGTGKTFMLNTLKEDNIKNFGSHRIVTVKISAQDILVSPPARIVPDKVKSLGYFQALIELLSDQLSDILLSLIESPNVFSLIHNFTNRKKSKIEDLILEMIHGSKSGEVVPAFMMKDIVIKDEMSLGKAIDEKGGETWAAKPQEPFEAKAGHSFTKKVNRKMSRELVEDYLNPIRYVAIRKKIVDLLKLCEIKQLNVLIDEWSSLDPSTYTNVQPIFADILKRAFGGSNMISVKIATNRYQTKFSKKSMGTSYTGLELGADIFEASNLDHVLTDHEFARVFYKNLLFKRLVLREPEVAEYFSVDDGVVEDEFVLSIFRNMNTFSEMIKGAEGIPREFLILFNEMCKRTGYTVKPTWSQDQIRRCIREKSIIGQPEAVDYHSAANQLLEKCIKPVTVKNASRLFFIKKEDMGMCSSATDELLEKRIIHEYPKTYINPKIRFGREAYLMDYGLWLDWSITFFGKDDTDRDIKLPLTKTRADEMTVDPMIIDNNMKVCQCCGNIFSKRARSYAKKKYCPECFEYAG